MDASEFIKTYYATYGPNEEHFNDETKYLLGYKTPNVTTLCTYFNIIFEPTKSKFSLKQNNVVITSSAKSQKLYDGKQKPRYQTVMIREVSKDELYGGDYEPKHFDDEDAIELEQKRTDRILSKFEANTNEFVLALKLVDREMTQKLIPRIYKEIRTTRDSDLKKTLTNALSQRGGIAGSPAKIPECPRQMINRLGQYMYKNEDNDFIDLPSPLYRMRIPIVKEGPYENRLGYVSRDGTFNPVIFNMRKMKHLRNPKMIEMKIAINGRNHSITMDNSMYAITYKSLVTATVSFDCPLSAYGFSPACKVNELIVATHKSTFDRAKSLRPDDIDVPFKNEEGESDVEVNDSVTETKDEPQDLPPQSKSKRGGRMRETNDQNKRNKKHKRELTPVKHKKQRPLITEDIKQNEVQKSRARPKKRGTNAAKTKPAPEPEPVNIPEPESDSESESDDESENDAESEHNESENNESGDDIESSDDTDNE